MIGRISQKINIAQVNSIRINKYINLLQFCTVLWVRFDVDILKLTARLAYSPPIEKSIGYIIFSCLIYYIMWSMKEMLIFS